MGGVPTKVPGLCVLVTQQPLWGHPGGVTQGPTAAGWGGWAVGEPPLTAGFADAVDGRHPEVGGARVEYHGEVLGGGPDGNLPKILHLAKSGADTPVSHRHAKKSRERGACTGGGLQRTDGVRCGGWLAPGQRFISHGHTVPGEIKEPNI